VSATGIVIYCLFAGLVVMTGLWAISIAIEDSSIVDIWWGAGFVLLGWTALLIATWGEGMPWPGGLVTLVLAMVSIWGLRLTFHLARRNLGHGEDPRYVAMREKAGASWRLRSLFQVFWLQGSIMWIVGLPVLVTVSSASLGGSTSIPSLAWLGVAIWAVGMFFETVGDLQLTRFKADPANKGVVMDRGLWRYTRHPNYFGDACVWWGLWVVAASAGHWWTFVGPALINFMLVRVSGKALLEKGMKQTRPGYAEYVERTSGFFPMPPKRPSA
jgi:steroid 5-alpha reductase family enzyme